MSMIWHAGNRQVPTFEQWRVKNPKRTWQEYCHACFHPDEHDNDPDAPRPTLPPHDFTFFPDGTPVLPSMDLFRYGKVLSVVLHTFFSLHWGTSRCYYLRVYRLTLTTEAASGIKDEPVAWKAVAKDTARYLPPDALPDELVFQNPMRMAVGCVKELWQHILDLQTSAETSDERFHWTHWWKRVGKGEDAGERLKAAYGKTPRPKHIAEAKRKGHAARTKRAPPPGAFGLNKRSEEGTGTDEGSSSAEDEGGAKAQGGKKKKSKSQRRRARQQDPSNVDDNAAPKDKGKAKAADDSASAKSSGAGSEAGEDIDEKLRNQSPDSPDEETFDLNVSDAEESHTAPNNGRDAQGKPIAGPSKPKPTAGPRKPRPKARPMKKAAGANAPEPPPDRSPEPMPEDTPGPDPLPHIPGPWDDAPVGRHGLGTGRIPPRQVILASATGNPPSWVESDPERIIPYLWSLSGEALYRDYLTSWRHMVSHYTTIAPDM